MVIKNIKRGKCFMTYNYLFYLAVILFSTKLLGLATKKIKLPQVVGALCAGLILGPACLNIVSETDFFSNLSELGVIVLMFTAGLETDIQELKKTLPKKGVTEISYKTVK